MSEKIEVILVDLGSTAIKSAEVIDGEIQKSPEIWEDLKAIRKHFYKGLPIAISSVRKNYEEASKAFSRALKILSSIISRKYQSN